MADPASPILVVSFGRIGDVVRSLTTVRMIAERHPGRPIDLICRPPADQLIRFAPYIRSVIAETTPHGRLGWGEKRAWTKRLRAAGYGRAYVLARSIKAALTPFLAGIPERIGYLGEGRLGLINRMRWDEKSWKHHSQRLGALALERGEAMPASLPPPLLAVDAEGLAGWRAREAVADDGRPVLVLAPGASFGPRRWDLAKWGEIAARAHGRGWHVWVVGSPEEKPLADAIAAFASVRDFTPSPLVDTAYQFSAATMVLANESGLAHVASAFGRPTVVLYGPTKPGDYGPINPNAHHIEPRPRATKAPREVDWIEVDEVDAVLQEIAAAGPGEDP